MSHLTYSSYPGFGQHVREAAHYSTAVKIPPGATLTISGQGGWNPDSDGHDISPDLQTEIAQAFTNVDLALRDGGGEGMKQVYKFIIYSAPWTSEAGGYMVAELRKWFPEHRPLLTVIGVEKLAWETMHIEVEAWAHLGEAK